MESSSALVAARLAAAGIDAAAIGWLGADYAITGGSFPVRVRAAGVVAAVTVSGLSSEQDHDLAVLPEADEVLVGQVDGRGHAAQRTVGDLLPDRLLARGSSPATEARA